MTHPSRTDAAESSAAPAAGERALGSRPARRPWTLQRRLILTIIGIVSAILVVVAIVTSAVLGRVLQDRLDQELRASVQDVGIDILRAGPDAMAFDVLAGGRQPPGFLLTLEDDAEISGAWVSDFTNVSELTPTQLDELADVATGEIASVGIEGLGEYRIAHWRSFDGRFAGVVGLPLTEVRATIAQMLTTIGLVTAAGLFALVLAATWTIRAGLAPLRAVAATASRVARQPLAQGEVAITERVPERQADPRTEVGQVGDALNTLLDHVDASLTARQRNEERMRRFVADASHELRTPLSSIRGYSELSLRGLRRDADGPGSEEDPTAQALERIQAQSIRMSSLVDDLLLLARLDEGQELVYSTVDLSRLVIEAVGDARAAGPDHRWELELGDEPVQLAGDTSRLHQVVANLLANARTHTPAGTTVTVSVQRVGEDAVIRVHDDGPGIEPGIRDELFERFSRADRSRTRQTGGSGLGLSIARAIVTAHHGEISVHSVPGDTAFEVRLPARPRDPEA
ncbi:HAMP domain-containing histidine kinase [Microbacterium sp. LRZ72]|uniref:sensor histidine kinase n=1 Tax=Microbacterium sp. LRZ72 TaxID=2942481 RepID=UPI0029A67229|nr:ATP-binding protein [Microbacterium sp. LRZ72]MDX2375839.1 HAMP domain-containing histidine kinase [Microbacterium sp. LRZ72]